MVDRIEILKDLKAHLINNYRDPIKDIILFGSQASNISNDNSDFDILILLDKDYSGKDENILLDLCYDIDLKYNIIIDAHLLSVSELDTLRGKQPVFINALKSGIYA
ncbi:MAG: nucleotidyltransferase domain-containing protein [Bacteroidetes bacterium]|nr:nucleotidyltransferase domain-containing protein [Bacteroidota bacterium]